MRDNENLQLPFLIAATASRKSKANNRKIKYLPKKIVYGTENTLNYFSRIDNSMNLTDENSKTPKSGEGSLLNVSSSNQFSTPYAKHRFQSLYGQNISKSQTNHYEESNDKNSFQDYKIDSQNPSVLCNKSSPENSLYEDYSNDTNILNCPEVKSPMSEFSISSSSNVCLSPSLTSLSVDINKESNSASSISEDDLSDINEMYSSQQFLQPAVKFKSKRIKYQEKETQDDIKTFNNVMSSIVLKESTKSPTSDTDSLNNSILFEDSSIDYIDDEGIGSKVQLRHNSSIDLFADDDDDDDDDDDTSNMAFKFKFRKRVQYVTHYTHFRK
ncbi:hypothetical protein C0J52_14958 [Blattella germanica]|nr:hypothetical protein C0J52_14958 [Blattella germanica]